MIVDHYLKYVFISVPKTASISVQFTLGHGHDIPEPDLYHQGIDEVLASYPMAEEYFKFGFVRNPWDRILSLYYDFTIKRKYQYSGLVKHDKLLFSEFSDFEGFCLNVGCSTWANNIFLKAQSELLGVNRECSKVNYVGRFESLEKDFAFICDKIGVQEKLKEMNTGEYNKGYRKHYSCKSAQAVADLYKNDIENFNYEF